MGGGAVADFQTLMDLIRETIDSDSWDDAEGNGRMRPFPMGVRIDAKGALQNQLLPVLITEVKNNELVGRLES